MQYLYISFSFKMSRLRSFRLNLLQAFTINVFNGSGSELSRFKMLRLLSISYSAVSVPGSTCSLGEVSSVLSSLEKPDSASITNDDGQFSFTKFINLDTLNLFRRSMLSLLPLNIRLNVLEGGILTPICCSEIFRSV